MTRLKKAAIEPRELTEARQRLSSGELRLKFAVLEDALRILLEGPRRAGSRQVWREARTWLLDRNRAYAFSYEQLCEALGIDAEALRSGVMAELAARVERATASHLRVVGSLRRLGQR